MLPFPPADSPSKPKTSSEFAHCPLSDAIRRKKKHPMCMACTALQHRSPRPETLTLQIFPRLAVHYVGSVSAQTNPDGYIRTSQKGEGAFLHPNDAIEEELLHFEVRFFLPL